MKSITKHTLDFIDSWLTLRWEWADIPGFTVAIAKDGDILFNRSYGYANIKTEEKLTPNHVFRIASHSKTFTATALMQLQEQGKLRIDDRVIDYLSWLNQHTDKRWKDVTVRQLLSHSAGVIRDGIDADYWQLARPFPNADELKAAILETDLVLEPNTKMKYSNYGYSLLGLVIEAVTGASYHQYVSEQIIKPLGLKNTKPEYDESLDITQGYSRLTVERTRHEVPHVRTNAMASATGFCSTAEDLCIYFMAHQVASGALLTDVSKREMQRKSWEISLSDPQEFYGLGLENVRRGARNWVGHGGGFPGHITQSMLNPKSGIVIVILTNCNGAIAPIANGIIDVVTELAATEPSEQLASYEGRFTEFWSSCEILAIGKKLYAINPNTWQPLDYKEELEVIDADTLKITRANGYMNEGEYVRYHRDNEGKPMKIIHSGTTMIRSQDCNIQTLWK